MTSRDTILQQVRNEVSKGVHLTAPPAPEVWPRNNPTPAVMAEQFTEELTAVHGEVIRCKTMQEARQRLAQLVAESQWTSVGAMDRPLVREVVGDIPSGVVGWAAADWTPKPMANLSVSVIEADLLLADTGSCLVTCDTAQDRLLCYLPPACAIIGKADRLAENMPAAWAETSRRVADPARRGEFVIITGPSRTADIEKILILGVHGPKRLVVFLID